jgi:hypothetical protein
MARLPKRDTAFHVHTTKRKQESVAMPKVPSESLMHSSGSGILGPNPNEVLLTGCICAPRLGSWQARTL